MVPLLLALLLALPGASAGGTAGQPGQDTRIGNKYHELSDKEILDHLLHKQRSASK